MTGDFTVCRLPGKKYKKGKETKENRDAKKETDESYMIEGVVSPLVNPS